MRLVSANSAIATSRTFLQAANTSPVLRTAPTPTTRHSSSFLVSSRRCFSQTAVQSKKGGKKEKKGAAPPSSSSSSSKDDGADDDGGNHPVADPADAFNFADVESRWQRSEVHHDEKFKELKRSLSGGGGAGDGEGGVDVDAIGKTQVTLKGEVEGEGESAVEAPSSLVPLSQLALVIPRAGGRVVELRMHNPASRKAIVSAVQTNPLFQGQQPQSDANDELVLLIKLGGVNDKTTSSAAAAAERTRRVHDLANAWRAQIRKATARRQKAHQQWKKDKTVQPDDLHRLDRDLLKGQEKRMAKIDAAEKEALKHAERINKR